VTGLTDRLSERAALDRLIETVRAGQNQALVMRGDAGVGKTALLDHLAGQASGSGCRVAPYTQMFLASLRGSQAELASLIAVANAKAAAEGQGVAATYAQWAAAIAHNGLGRYEEALAAARQAGEHSHLYVSIWALPELIEAAVRVGDTQVAADALERLAERTQAGGTDFGLGLAARCRALLSDGVSADDLYGEAIDRLSRTRLRPELARAHLLYGEWLRREGRRLDAREQLRAAHGMLAAIGMEAFAERARLELIATGEIVRKRGVETVTNLTAQEAHIARLARDGRTNPEIGAQLYLSARTVEWHLRKVFAKLGIGSRRELDAALVQHGQDASPEGLPASGDSAPLCARVPKRSAGAGRPGAGPPGRPPGEGGACVRAWSASGVTGTRPGSPC
jgi:DNA-binding CsgD family transcriptional regulator